MLDIAIDWVRSDGITTIIGLLAAVAASHAGYHFSSFVQDKWSKRKL
jgi:hypothetical protein